MEAPRPLSGYGLDGLAAEMEMEVEELGVEGVGVRVDEVGGDGGGKFGEFCAGEL